MATSNLNTDQTAAARPAAAACLADQVRTGMFGNGKTLARRCVR